MVSKNKATSNAFRYSALATCVALTLPLSIQAKAAENTTGAKEQGLAEVVVTAERRKATAQKTAISLIAVTGEQLQEKAQTTVESVLREVPAVTVQNTPQGASVYVRGVGSNGDANYIDSAVAVMLDGVYAGRAETIFSGMFDVSRMEVLRGPQGTLYGRNATGGVINILTNSPVIGKTEGSINAQLGNYNLHRVDGALNLPVNDSLAFRVAGVSEQRDGYYSNGGRAADFVGGRVKALVKPAQGVSILGTIDYSNEQGAGATSVAGIDGPVASNGDTWTKATGSWSVDPLHPADRRQITFTTYSLQLDWDLGWANLTYIPAKTHSKRRVASNLVTGYWTNTGADYTPLGWNADEEDQTTHELRLSSATDSVIKWQTGIYSLSSFNRNTETSVQNLLGTGSTGRETYGAPGLTTSRAVFGQVTYPFTDATRLTVGVRRTEDSKIQNWGIRNYSSGVLVSDTGLQTSSDSYSATTYKVGLEYDLTPRAMVYGSVSTGYKAGGFSTAVFPAQSYEPEKLRATEIGIKSRFLDNKLQLNAAAFSYDYDGLQVQYADFPGGNFSLVVTNAGKGKIKGFEVESKYKITPEDTLSVSYAYTDSRYGKFSTSSLSYLDGQATAMTPKTSANVGYEHIWEMASGATLSAKLQAKFSDGYLTSVEKFPPFLLDPDSSLYHQGNFHRTDLSVTYRSSDEIWSVGAWLKNLENKSQITEVKPYGRIQGTDPRTIGVSFGYKF